MPLVCIDCRYIGPRASGIANVVQGMVDHLPQLAPELDFLLLKSPAAQGLLSEAENVREVVVHAAANGPTTMWWLPRVVDLSQVDLFHATFNIMPAGLAMPCLTTVHDVMWLTNPELCSASLSRLIDEPFYRHGIRRALRKSAAIATVSNASREEIVALAPHLAGRVHVTEPATSPDYRRVPVKPGDLARIGLPHDRKLVLTVGQYVPYKNHEGAIRAFAQVATVRDDVDLVMVQRRNPRSAQLTALADSLGIGSRVHFLSGLDEQHMILLFSAATALLHPSYCEGFGLPLAEAMACGCPAVASNRAAIPEVVGDAALLADPDDHRGLAAALLRIIAEPGFAATLAERGLARNAQRSWLEFARQNLTVQRNVLANCK